MMKNINAGDLRHRITLNRVANRTAQDSVGQMIPTYTTVGTYYALVECLGAAESTNANQLKGALKYKVTVRAASGPIYPSDQIAWNGHNLGVVGAVTDPFGIMITLDCSEKGQQ